MATSNPGKGVALIQTDSNVTYGVNQYAIDSADKLENLPKTCMPGSAAIDISTGDVYMLNTSREWKKI